MPSSASVPHDPLANIASWLIATAIALIGLDPFNVSLGLFSLKPAMVPLGLAVALTFVRWLGGHAITPPKNLPAILFLIYAIFTCTLFYLGATNTTALVGNVDATLNNPIGKTFNIVMLSTFAFMGVTYLNGRHLSAGILGLALVQLCIALYCVWLLSKGEYDKIFWLPGGMPRISLNQGGNTPNAMGGIWLVVAVVQTFLIIYQPGSKWRWSIVVLAAFGAIATMSRSMMIGLAVLAFAYTIIRPRFFIVLLNAVALVGAIAAFLIYQSKRIADASALDRLSKWTFTLSAFQENIIFGSGSGTNPAPHSVWLQILSETGLIGFFLMLITVFQIFIQDGTHIRRSLEFFVILFLPYAFYLSVDIPLLQWQTWVLPIAAYIGHREFSSRKQAPSTALRPVHL